MQVRNPDFDRINPVKQEVVKRKLETLQQGGFISSQLQEQLSRRTWGGGISDDTERFVNAFDTLKQTSPGMSAKTRLDIANELDRAFALDIRDFQQLVKNSDAKEFDVKGDDRMKLTKTLEILASLNPRPLKDRLKVRLPDVP